jgi:putative ABC transport system permease protein
MNMDRVLQDLRYALRTLIRNPGFALVAILTLGLGIGANTAVFSAINAVVLRPLPYGDPSRLVLIRQSAPAAGRPDTGVSIKEYFDYREQSREFEALVEYHQMSFDLLRRGEPDRVDTGVVSHNFFDVLGIRPILGRTFVADDDKPGAEPVLILSHRYWTSKFAGDASVVGQVFEMNDRPHLVIGVLPDVPHYPEENDVYMPVLACPFRAAAERRIPQNRRVFSILNVFGKLKPGVPPETAASGVGAICHSFTRDNPAAYRATSGFQATTIDVQSALTEDARPMLLVLLGTTALVLLLACANVANLTLARLLRRERELALRTALGLPWGRLMQQLLTESAVLALLGGIVGLGFAAATMNLLRMFLGRLTSRAEEISLDPWVLAFTLIVATATGMVFGTLPAVATSRVQLAEPLKEGGRGGGTAPAKRRLQEALVIAQVAVSVILLIAAGLLIASFLRLQRVNPGYRSDGVLSAQASGNFSKYPDADSLLRVYLPLVDRLHQVPGVQSAAITTGVPLSATQPFNVPFVIERDANDDPDRRPSTDVRIASTRYFETLRVPILGGRAFTESDSRDAPLVVMINQSSVRHWAGRDPIGTRVSLDNGQTWRTVIGIVGDIRQFGLNREVQAQIYLPMRQAPFAFPGQILVRTAGEPMLLARAVREAVHALDPDMPVEDVVTLSELRHTSLGTPRITATLLSIFAGLAFFVTLTGIAGVLATSVAQRTREIGIRMALGESRTSVLRSVLQRGLILTGVGLLIGFIGALLTTRFLAAYLYATEPSDPATLAAVAIAFVAAALVACAGPAWRAMRVDPMIALRAD